MDFARQNTEGQITEGENQPFPIQRSSLYTVWLLEKQAIGEHKWYMSERAGFDIGWAAAKFDWDMRFRPGWISGMKAAGLYPS